MVLVTSVGSNVRVAVHADGTYFSEATTDENGLFRASAPSGEAVHLIVEDSEGYKLLSWGFGYESTCRCPCWLCAYIREHGQRSMA